MALDQRLCRAEIDIADDGQNGVGWNIMALIKCPRIFERQSLDIAFISNRIVAIRVRLECGCRHRIEQDRRGVVLITVHLRSDRAFFCGDRCGVDCNPVHPVGFDAQQKVEPILWHRGEISSLVDPGVSVPLAASIVNCLGRRGVGEVLAGPEGQMLEEMRQAGLAGYLIARATHVERLHADHREAMILKDHHGEPVRQARNVCLGKVKLRERRCRSNSRDDRKLCKTIEHAPPAPHQWRKDRPLESPPERPPAVIGIFPPS